MQPVTVVPPEAISGKIYDKMATRYWPIDSKKVSRSGTGYVHACKMPRALTPST